MASARRPGQASINHRESAERILRHQLSPPGSPQVAYARIADYDHRYWWLSGRARLPPRIHGRRWARSLRSS
jgi:hypothetical protein